jgi:hypothetical protein
MDAPTHAASPADVDPRLHALANEHEELLAFLYAAPVGLMQTNLTGHIELVNAHTAMLLMPLSQQHGCGLDNLFDLLAPLAPDLSDRVAAHGRRTGVVVDGLRLALSQPGEPVRYGALSLIKLNDHRLMATITDVTLQVQAERDCPLHCRRHALRNEHRHDGTHCASAAPPVSLRPPGLQGSAAQ